MDARAPKQSEVPFVVAQLVLMALFVVLGIFVVKRFDAGTGPWCCGVLVSGECSQYRSFSQDISNEKR